MIPAVAKAYMMAMLTQSEIELLPIEETTSPSSLQVCQNINPVNIKSEILDTREVDMGYHCS